MAFRKTVEEDPRFKGGSKVRAELEKEFPQLRSIQSFTPIAPSLKSFVRAWVEKRTATALGGHEDEVLSEMVTDQLATHALGSFEPYGLLELLEPFLGKPEAVKYVVEVCLWVYELQTNPPPEPVVNKFTAVASTEATVLPPPKDKMDLEEKKKDASPPRRQESPKRRERRNSKDKVCRFFYTCLALRGGLGRLFYSGVLRKALKIARLDQSPLYYCCHSITRVTQHVTAMIISVKKVNILSSHLITLGNIDIQSI
jgi:hypothetical protein